MKYCRGMCVQRLAPLGEQAGTVLVIPEWQPRALVGAGQDISRQQEPKTNGAEFNMAVISSRQPRAVDYKSTPSHFS